MANLDEKSLSRIAWAKNLWQQLPDIIAAILVFIFRIKRLETKNIDWSSLALLTTRLKAVSLLALLLTSIMLSLLGLLFIIRYNAVVVALIFNLIVINIFLALFYFRYNLKGEVIFSKIIENLHFTFADRGAAALPELLQKILKDYNYWSQPNFFKIYAILAGVTCVIILAPREINLINLRTKPISFSQQKLEQLKEQQYFHLSKQVALNQHAYMQMMRNIEFYEKLQADLQQSSAAHSASAYQIQREQEPLRKVEDPNLSVEEMQKNHPEVVALVKSFMQMDADLMERSSEESEKLYQDPSKIKENLQVLSNRYQYYQRKAQNAAYQDQKQLVRLQKVLAGSRQKLDSVCYEMNRQEHLLDSLRLLSRK